MDTIEIRALRRAIEVAGSQCELARRLVEHGYRTSQPTISWWLRETHRCAAEAAPYIERATGIPKQELRPDLYGEIERGSTCILSKT